MNKNLILKADILDIIFENRNKAYGAYDLRKFYPDRLKLSLGLMLIIATVFAVFILLPEKTNRVIAGIYTIPEPELTKADMEPKKPEKKPEKKDPQTNATPVNQKQHTNNIAVVSQTDKSDTIQTLLPDDVIGKENIVNAKPGLILVQPVKPGSGAGEPAVTPKIDVTVPMDLNVVDEPPTYPGGVEALRKFLQRNLNNPKDMDEGESVSVRIRFVVNYTGKLQSFVTALDGGEEFNKEVIRVLKKMPEWIPGKAKGQNVSVYYTIPVKFVPAY